MSFRLLPKSVTFNDLERRHGGYFELLWPTYEIGQAIIFLPCVFYAFSIFYHFSSPNLSATDRMSTTLPHMVWPYSAYLECTCEMC